MLDHLVGLLLRALNAQVTGAKPLQVQKEVSPAEIGYERFLYTTPGIPEEYAQQFEAKFLSPVDSRAASAHKVLLKDEPIVWTQAVRSDWTRFIGSMFFRTPENLAAYKQAIRLVLSQDTPELRAAYSSEQALAMTRR